MKNSEQPAYSQSDLGHALIKEGRNNSRYGFGLTKREYFAGLAMQGIIYKSIDIKTMEYIIDKSIKYADALLKELEKQN